MARGPGPSWNKETQPIVEPVFDLGEAASRQIFGFGSFSRSGRWLYASDMRDGLAPFQYTGASLDTTNVHQGTQSIKLLTPAILDDWAGVMKYFYPVADNNLGLEVMFAITDGVAHTSYVLQILDDTGAGNAPVGYIRVYVNGATKKLQYAQGTKTTGRIGGLTWVDIADLTDLCTDSIFFHNFKLVIDNENGKYDYVIFDGKRYDLDDLALADQSQLYVGRVVNFFFFIVTHEAVAREIYVDNFIITAEIQ